jgi:hypothetical protein
MWVAAFRRLGLLLVGLSAGIVVISLPVGVLAGSSAARSISLGFDCVGAFAILVGFLAGSRGPLRYKREPTSPLFGDRLMRWATPGEREETLNLSAVFVFLGFVLLVIGLALDPRYSLF